MNKYICKIHTSLMPANGWAQFVVWADNETDADTLMRMLIYVPEDAEFTITLQ